MTDNDVLHGVLHGSRQAGRTILCLGSSALALGLVLTTAPARAQQATQKPESTQPATDTVPQGELEEVVVRGFRASLESALNIKRDEAGVVDVIKAEDIAAFPDQNLAESLQRIPGVAISRVGGEGRQISVRGLGPEYTRVRINGMEALATSGGTSSGGAVGNNRGRGFDFNVFASELFNSLTVRKTGSAEVEEGSLGATVDLNTGRPFDYREPAFVVSSQLGYNDLSDQTDPRLAALATRQWADGKIGALLSVAYGERRSLEELHGTTRWGPGGANGGFNAASTLPGYTIGQINASNPATALFHPRNPSYNSYDQTQKRLGVTGGLQFRLSSATLLSVNGLYSRLEGDRQERLLQAISFSRSGSAGKSATIIRDGVVDADNNLVYGLFDNVDMRSQASQSELTTTFQQFTADLRHEFTDRFAVSGLVGYAQSVFDSPRNTTVTFENLNVDGYSYDYRNNDRVPRITLGFDPTNPAGWATVPGSSALNIDQFKVENTFKTAKLDGTYQVSDGFSVKVGADIRKFAFDSEQRIRVASETDVQTLTPQQIADMSTLVRGFGKGLGLPAGSPASWLVPDISAYANAFDIYSNTGRYRLGSIEQSDARGGNFEVEEEDIGQYLQGEFVLSLFGRPLRGDIGVRYFRTQQRSTGYAAVGSAVQLVSAERTYTKALPSLNTVYELTDTFQMRFGAARTIARPSLGSLTPGGDISVQGGNRSYSTGNPDLKPTQSDNLDLSFEWYPSQGAIYSAGLFYKDISTFAQILRTSRPFNTLGLPEDLLTGTVALPTDDFDVTQPVNSDGGSLQGFEINIQQPLRFLPGFLSNFGVLANYTFVDSDIAYLTSDVPGAPTVSATLVGLSKHAANATLYYEGDAFSIRGSLAYRSGYLTQIPGRNGNFEEGTNSTLNFDMRASYNFTDKLQFSLEAINLTDEVEDRYVDDSNRPWVYSHTGRQYFLGLRYSY
jgi:TonB-dependent receptor